MSQKVTEEQLDALRSLQMQFDSITQRYGELKFQSILMKQERDLIVQAMHELEVNRNKMVVQIQEMYGSTGQVDLETGEFTPDNPVTT